MAFLDSDVLVFGELELDRLFDFDTAAAAVDDGGLLFLLDALRYRKTTRGYEEVFRKLRPRLASRN